MLARRSVELAVKLPDRIEIGLAAARARAAAVAGALGPARAPSGLAAREPAGVPGRDMRWCDRGAGDAGTGEEAGDEILLPGRDRLVPPVLEAASAAGGKGGAVRLAALG